MPKMVSMQQLQDAIGNDAASILKQRFTGMQIYFPKKQDTRFVSLKNRNRNIKDDYFMGLDISDLEEKYDLKRSQIYKIVNSKQDAE